MGIAVKTEGLSKTYRLRMQKEPVNAVCDLNLEVHEGEIFGFLGPNGAGKTTTIKILLGLTYPTSGQAWILDRPAGDNEVKKEISYLPESPYFYDYMSGTELLNFYAGLFGLEESVRRQRIEHLLQLVGLYKDRHKRLSQYSKGMLQRIGIAQALVNDPKLLFFDEPTSGLDPIAHSEIRDLILRLREDGKTVFLSSHQLSDVEMVCDRVSILNRGKLLKIGRLDEMLLGTYVKVAASGIDDATQKVLEGLTTDMAVTDGITLMSSTEGESLNKVIDAIRSGKGQIISIVPHKRALEDLFMEIIKEGNK